VHIILVDSLDTRAIEESYEVDSDNGRPPFYPKTLLKVALFALHSCRFSLRKMEEDTINNLAYKWLTGDMTIDHSTMGLFLSRFGGEIVEMFSQVVASCMEQNLIEFDLLAIDSVKLRASANYKQSKTLERINIIGFLQSWRCNQRLRAGPLMAVMVAGTLRRDPQQSETRFRPAEHLA